MTKRSPMKRCFACMYWMGKRMPSRSGYSVEFDTNEKAMCGYTRFQMKGDNSCSHFQPWSVLKW